MAGISAPYTGVLAAIAAMFALVSGDARASEEAVDRVTQTALSLDAHPDRGALQFRQYCARCHGSQAQGDANRAIPALAGQHFAYLVRQLANFSGFERDSNTMHGVLSQIELRGPQTWVDIAAFLNRATSLNRAQTGDGAHVAPMAAIMRHPVTSPVTPITGLAANRSNTKGYSRAEIPTHRYSPVKPVGACGNYVTSEGCQESLGNVDDIAKAIPYFQRIFPHIASHPQRVIFYPPSTDHRVRRK